MYVVSTRRIVIVQLNVRLKIQAHLIEAEDQARLKCERMRRRRARTELM